MPVSGGNRYEQNRKKTDNVRTVYIMFYADCIIMVFLQCSFRHKNTEKDSGTRKNLAHSVPALLKNLTEVASDINLKRKSGIYRNSCDI